MARGRNAATHVPTREEVLSFVEGAGRGLSRREVVAALAREQGQKTAVRDILRELAQEGIVGRRRGKPAPEERPSLSETPRVTVLDVVGIDDNGDLRLEHPDRPELAAILPADTVDGPAPGVGDRVLARLRPGDDGMLEARVTRMLPRRPTTIVGIVESASDGWRLRPADRR